jgi:hypothetical protein
MTDQLTVNQAWLSINPRHKFTSNLPQLEKGKGWSFSLRFFDRICSVSSWYKLEADTNHAFPQFGWAGSMSSISPLFAGDRSVLYVDAEEAMRAYCVRIDAREGIGR